MNASAEGQPTGPPIVVTHRAGLQFVAQVGNHEVTVDQPTRGGGADAGPSPLEFLGTALGSCIALYVHKFLAARMLDTEGLRVEVTQYSVRNPHRIARFDVTIALPLDVPRLYRPMIETTARVCPAYNTLARSAEIAIVISSAAPAQVPA